MKPDSVPRSLKTQPVCVCCSAPILEDYDALFVDFVTRPFVVLVIWHFWLLVGIPSICCDVKKTQQRLDSTWTVVMGSRVISYCGVGLLYSRSPSTIAKVLFITKTCLLGLL